MLAATFAPKRTDPPDADPRPELTEDHHRWVTLLRMAAEVDFDDPHGVYGALLGVRCLGARLGEDGDGWRLLKPDDVPLAEWEALREQWLVPHASTLWKLLAPTKERSHLVDVGEDQHGASTGHIGDQLKLTFDDKSANKDAEVIAT